MSINFLCGKPRNGKSLYAMRLIEREMLTGNRIVVTNVAIKWWEFREHLGKLGFVGELEKRLQILEGEEVRQFYRYRGRGRTFRMGKRAKDLDEIIDCSRVYIETELLAQELESEGLICTRDETGIWATPGNGKGRAGGIVYVLDEIHVHFDSRAWAATGPSATFYNTQHGKLSDDVALVTQHVELVEKRFRLLAQEFVYLKNLKKSSFGFGLFGMPGIFMRSHYLQPFTGAVGQTAMEVRTFTLDYALANCYETAAGVGFIGGDADKGEKKRGLPWQIAATGVLAGIVALCFVPSLIGKGFQSVIDKMSGETAKHLPAKITGGMSNGVVAPVPALPASLIIPASQTRPSAELAKSDEEPEEKVTGIASFGGRTYVALDSGRMLVCHPKQVIEQSGLVGTMHGIFKWTPRKTEKNSERKPWQTVSH